MAQARAVIVALEALGVALGVGLGACGSSSTARFVCARDVECNNSAQGLCLAGYCAYPDVTCPGSGYRYSKDAGSQANQCVAPPDATPPDVVPFPDTVPPPDTLPPLDACAPGLVICGGSGGCVDPTSDPAHCGGCAPSNTCAAGQYCQSMTCIDTPMARPIAPLSTGFTTSNEPTFRFAPGAGTTGTLLEICADRACTTVQTSMTIASPGATWKPTSPLPAGLHFWRVHGLMGSVVGNPSPSWEVTIHGHTTGGSVMSYGADDDFDGDGFPDIVMAGQQTLCTYTQTYVWQSAGSALTGNLGNTNTYVVPITPGNDFESFSNAGDVNGDGYGDLLIGPQNATSELFLGGPTGINTSGGIGFGCGIAWPYVTHNLPSELALGDVDGDGYADVAGMCQCGIAPPWCIYYGDSTGSLSRKAQIPGTGGTSGSSTLTIVGIGDEDGDGYSDLAVSWVDTATIASIYRGGPSGLVTTPAATLSSTSQSGLVNLLGDINADGQTDVVIAGQIYLGPLSSTSTGIAAPTGTLMAAGDVNGDGLDDVLGSAGVYYGKGGSIGPSTTVSTPLPAPVTSALRVGPGFGSLGDLDQDGFDDVLVFTAQDSTGNTVTAFYGGTTGLSQPSGGLQFTKIGCGSGDSELACLEPRRPSHGAAKPSVN
jgi:hypothetical protein